MHHAARKVKSLVLNDIGVSIGAHYYASQLAPYACRYVAALDALQAISPVKDANHSGNLLTNQP